jgi:hypothetical protein
MTRGGTVARRAAPTILLLLVLTLGTLAPAASAAVGHRSVQAAPRAMGHLVSPVSSTNWAGYADLGSAGSVTDVQGSWTVPSFHGSCGGLYNFSVASFWVGIDGYSSNTVEQIGTSVACYSLFYSGYVSYYAWYELYPAGENVLSLTISPGDKISAQVNYSSATGAFVLSLTDHTTGVSSSTSSGALSVNRSSAEWIAEAPSSSSGILPLVDFGKVLFTGASATIGGHTGSIASASSARITMVNQAGTAHKATTGKLLTSGTSFRVTWASYGP